ncbi:hypothetical protein IU459_16925 [Nocardia amamiensis]|uniref:Uncharacterized protein n=1 Tax=Nocardia amamiensis TaxID=404578 RepID=A0ABS0CRF6_9NOCA|nr:hypothetical protein [Nocardia amamiensis]MBF6299213.1 hypothetical protein [Nocardia amamiensis]
MAETEDHLRNFPEHPNELANRRPGYLLSRYVESSMIEMEQKVLVRKRLQVAGPTRAGRIPIIPDRHE